MRMRCNLHTHTSLCDGRDTPEALVQAALALGMESLGFTGHCLTPFDRSYCMDEEKTRQYQEEITRLKQAYQGQISLFCGIEQDRFGLPPVYAYDYAIGSVHYVQKDGQLFPVDEGTAPLLRAVECCYGGDPYALLEDYFQAICEIGMKTDIIGHFDLVTKFHERQPWFDDSHPRYRRAALAALDTLIQSGHRLFEINTGAMARGYRSSPYPAVWLLRELQRRGAEICINSDCHDRSQLAFAYPQAVSLALSCGFTRQTILTADGWQQIPLSGE